MKPEDIEFLRATALLLKKGSESVIYRSAQGTSRELSRIADEEEAAMLAEVERFKDVVARRVVK